MDDIEIKETGRLRKRIKLSVILGALKYNGIRASSYMFGTFLDVCGLPYCHSLYNHETGLIDTYRPKEHKNGDHYMELMQLFSLLKIKYRVVHLNQRKGIPGLLGRKIKLVTEIINDIPPEIMTGLGRFKSYDFLLKDITKEFRTS